MRNNFDGFNRIVLFYLTILIFKYSNVYDMKIFYLGSCLLGVENRSQSFRHIFMLL